MKAVLTICIMFFLSSHAAAQHCVDFFEATNKNTNEFEKEINIWIESPRLSKSHYLNTLYSALSNARETFYLAPEKAESGFSTINKNLGGKIVEVGEYSERSIYFKLFADGKLVPNINFRDRVLLDKDMNVVKRALVLKSVAGYDGPFQLRHKKELSFKGSEDEVRDWIKSFVYEITGTSPKTVLWTSPRVVVKTRNSFQILAKNIKNGKVEQMGFLALDDVYSSDSIRDFQGQKLLGFQAEIEFFNGFESKVRDQNELFAFKESVERLLRGTETSSSTYEIAEFIFNIEMANEKKSIRPPWENQKNKKILEFMNY